MINLSDDVEVDTIMVSNNEDFSANLEEIKFHGASDFPPPDNNWIKIGSIKPAQSTGSGVYLLDLSKQDLPMVRYLKVTFKGPKLTEGLYCTLTHLKVYGRSMHAVMQDSLMDLINP